MTNQTWNPLLVWMMMIMGVQSFLTVPSVHYSFARMIHPLQMSHNEDIFEQVTRSFDAYESIPHALVAQGKDFVLLQQELDEDAWWLSKEKERVVGCLATVYVRIAIHRQTGQVSLLHPDNTADAILSRGLLAMMHILIFESTHSKGTNMIEWDPNTIADQVGIRHILSPGRNDGLASMTTVIQHQIRQYYNDDINVNENSTNTHNQTTFQAAMESESYDSKLSLSELEKEDVVGTKSRKEEDGRVKVAMLLSGGVDSSVALSILADQRDRYDVTAFYLKIWLEEELGDLLGQSCPWEDDVDICQQVCEQLDVPLEIVNLQQEYHQRVISYTLEESQKGRTPNPDIQCNSRIKFGVFYDYVITQRQFDYIASGHYAQTSTSSIPTENNDNSSNNNKLLFRSPDAIKDQSYFLSALTPQQLSKILFPIGQYTKSKIRELATSTYNLPNQQRPDSQGLCFLGKVKFDDFLKAYLGTQPGPIVDIFTQQTIGQHEGLWYHTVGQRKGLGKALYPKITSQGPWYVVAKDPQQNIIYVSNEYETNEQLIQPRSQFTVEDILWITYPPTLDLTEEKNGHNTLRCDMKIRHGPKIVQGTLQLIDDSKTVGNIQLDLKDGGLAPGQFVAFYQLNGDECFGSGVISEKHWVQFLSSQQQEQSQGEDNQILGQEETLI